MFLHNVGEMIYFKNEDFVVMSPNWFCNEMMGCLITLHGDVEKNQLEANFSRWFW
jgi:hypothetical protein